MSPVPDVKRRRWQDFWNKRCAAPLCSIVTGKNGNPPLPRPPYLSGFDGEYKKAAASVAAWYESCEFHGDAIPFFALSFGADDFASFLGADLILGASGGTSWPVHTLTTLRGADIRFRREGKWWTKNMEFLSVLKKELGDDVMIAPPTLTAGLDALVALYGAENLLLDMVEEPEAVHEALEMINSAYTEVFDALAQAYDFKRLGSINRHGMYSTGRLNLPQCDFSCMISPAMFDEFAVPCIEHEFSLMDAGEYHLDGPGSIKHLERLAKIEKLNVVQWVAGAGEAADKDWTPLYRRVLDLGKGLILGVHAGNVECLLRSLPSKDIFLMVYGAETKGEAEGVLETIDKLRGDGLFI